MRERGKQSILRYWLIGFCGMLVLFGSGCSSATTGHASIKATATALPPTATAISSSPPFPAFHDWRAAYLAPDNHFHAVSIDGKTDVMGPSFPGFGGGGSTLPTANASPDGRYIAFINDVTLVVYDLWAKTPASAIVHSGYKYLPTSMFWSPDSQRVVLGAEGFTNNSTMVIPITPINIPAGKPLPGTSMLPDDTGPGTYPHGWIDNHNLLVYTFEVQSTTPFSSTGILEAVDSTTGAKRIILKLPHAERFNAQFSLSPDGQEAILYTFSAHDQPYMPMVRLINLATGDMRPLPTKSGNVSVDVSGIGGAAWRPGTHDIAITAAGIDPSIPTVGNWLFNIDTGAITPIPSTDAIQSWSPDGSTLVLSNAINDQNDTTKGGFTLTAATFDANGKVTLTKLTDQAMAFTFLGFIRSA